LAGPFGFSIIEGFPPPHSEGEIQISKCFPKAPRFFSAFQYHVFLAHSLG
jgi:hypothetical protein